MKSAVRGCARTAEDQVSEPWSGDDYDTQPTVTKLAEDRAEQLKRDPDKVYAEIDDRIREDARKAGDFTRVHAFARSAADVPDDQDARLVVLPAEHVYTKDGTSPAEVAAKTLLESRGNSPRLFRNSLVFLAADKARMQDLDEAVRRYLAWKSIVGEADMLDLGKNQRGQAETQLKAAASMVLARIPETYQWMLVPVQANPQDSVTFQATRLSGSDALAVRASKKLRSEELLVTSLGPTILKKHPDDVPLWPEARVSVRPLIDYFATYIYLSRLSGPDVLLGAIRGGLALLTWTSESFAYADSFDEAGGRYRGLRAGQNVAVTADSTGFLVKPEIACQQLDAETPKPGVPVPGRPTVEGTATVDGPPPKGGRDQSEPVPAVRRFFGTVTLDPTRVGRDAGRIAEEVIAHLVGQVGADVTVRLEIAADLPKGVSDQVVRTVTENSRTLKFDTHGFEKD
jgi:hypothetical protein